jgi:hypothetical protein
MLAVKQWVGVVLLAVVAVWPAVHHGLYRRYGIDPWKLCGFAMYTRPHAAHQLQVLEVRDGEARPLRVRSPRLAAEAEHLGRQRGALGELGSPDRLGRMVLAELPDVDHVRLVLQRVDFDCRTTRLDRVETRTYDYTRDTGQPPARPLSGGPS